MSVHEFRPRHRSLLTHHEQRPLAPLRGVREGDVAARHFRRHSWERLTQTPRPALANEYTDADVRRLKLESKSYDTAVPGLPAPDLRHVFALEPKATTAIRERFRAAAGGETPELYRNIEGLMTQLLDMNAAHAHSAMQRLLESMIPPAQWDASTESQLKNNIRALVVLSRSFPASADAKLDVRSLLHKMDRLREKLASILRLPAYKGKLPQDEHVVTGFRPDDFQLGSDSYFLLTSSNNGKGITVVKGGRYAGDVIWTPDVEAQRKGTCPVRIPRAIIDEAPLLHRAQLEANGAYGPAL